ncbi:MAG: oligopeptide:H+ symporter [Micrococcaceae bacterium]
MTTVNVNEQQLTKTTFDDKGFFGHPKPLATLFGVETWERFSFYSVQSILLFYITYKLSQGGLGLDTTTGKSIAGAYGGMVFLSSIVFAWISDRVLGREKTLFVSAIIVMVGHISMAAIHGVPGLIVGLLLIACGGGGVKASASSMVGSLYQKGDVRTDSGFSLYYFGINVGAFLGPLIAGWLMQEYGFHWAFAAAAIGMALGVAQYVIQRKQLPEVCQVPTNPLAETEKAKARNYALAGVAVAVLIGIFVGTSSSRLAFFGANISNIIAVVAFIISVILFSMLLTTPKTTDEEKSRVKAFIPLFISQVAFWALYQQIFTMLPDYVDSKLDRKIFGWEMPAAWVNSISAVYIIIFAVAFAAMWTKWGEKQPSTPAKFAFANILMGIAYFLFIPVANVAPHTAPLLWIMFILLMFCFSELCISPIGMSVTTRLAPAKFTTIMMALYLLATAIGTSLAGTIATFYHSDAANNSPYFVAVGIVSIIVGLFVVVCIPYVKKMMAGVR